MSIMLVVIKHAINFLKVECEADKIVQNRFHNNEILTHSFLKIAVVYKIIIRKILSNR